MFVDACHSWVEDVGQAVLAQILFRKNSEDLGELVVFVDPHSSQICYATNMLLEMVEANFELDWVDAQVIEYSISVLSISGDEV